jgi:hypothetical protein
MILLKDLSIKYDGLQPEMYYALGVAAAIRKDFFDLNCVITSLLDGEHNPGSLHPKGLAADLRTLDLTTGEREKFFDALKGELYPLGYDVVWEGGVGETAATTAAHIHVEFQPKPGRNFWHNL